MYLPEALSGILEKSAYVIKYESWVNAERDDTRYSVPSPTDDTVFLEVDQAMVMRSSRREKWVRDWGCLKYRCDRHQGPWYNCYVLERYGDDLPRDAVAVEPKMKYGGVLARTSRRKKVSLRFFDVEFMR